MTLSRNSYRIVRSNWTCRPWTKGEGAPSAGIDPPSLLFPGLNEDIVSRDLFAKCHDINDIWWCTRADVENGSLREEAPRKTLGIETGDCSLFSTLAVALCQVDHVLGREKQFPTFSAWHTCMSESIYYAQQCKTKLGHTKTPSLVSAGISKRTKSV